jgi:putative HD superfamily hydrolase of NAD metabolism
MTADEKSLIAYVKKQIGRERFIHSQNTAAEAVSLARIYGIDNEKAKIAGLLHDIGKGHFKEAARYGVVLDEIEMQNPELAHGRIGAAMARADLGIDDREILSAISWHTTGRAGMSLLDKIIYLADIIEPGRKFPGVEEIRTLARTDIDAAMVIALEQVIAFVRSKGFALHQKSIEAYQYLKEREDTKKIELS